MSRKPTAEEKQNFEAEFLSPVSKLEYARKRAEIEQQRRIDEACNRLDFQARLKSRKLLSLKRKEISSSLENHMKTKLRNVHDFPVETTPEQKSSWIPFRSKTYQATGETPLPVQKARQSRSIAAGKENNTNAFNLATKRESPQEYAIRKASDHRSRDESIQQYAIRKSAAKRKTNGPPAKVPSNVVRAESYHSRAIRAAKANKKEREQSALFSPTPLLIPGLMDEPVSFDTSLNAQSPVNLIDEFDNVSGSEEEDTMEDIEDVDEDIFQSVKESRISNTLTIIGLLLSCVIFGGILFGTIRNFSTMNTKFCNSVDNASTSIMQSNQAFVCMPCPQHGICVENQLQSCTAPYIIFEQQCVLSKEVEQDADKMALKIYQFLNAKVEKKFCGSFSELMRSFVVDDKVYLNEQGMVMDDDVTMLDVIKVELRKFGVWESVNDNIFEVTFKKALESLEKLHGISIIHGNKIHLTLAHTSSKCQLMYHVLQHFREYLLGLLVAVLLVWIYHGMMRRKKDQHYLELIYTRVTDQLIEQAKASEVQLRAYPCNNLCDHILDGLNISRKERLRYKKQLWPLIEQRVLEDSRIRQVPMKYRGCVVNHWEWISPDFTKTSTTPITTQTDTIQQNALPGVASVQLI